MFRLANTLMILLSETEKHQKDPYLFWREDSTLVSLRRIFESILDTIPLSSLMVIREGGEDRERCKTETEQLSSKDIVQAA